MVDPAEEPTPIWDRFPSDERLAINFTLTCNLACAHCIVESSPQRRERLTSEEVHTALLAGKRGGKRHVTFSGGEVFLYPREMCELIAFAREQDYVVDVETNAFWAKTDVKARAKLAPFVEAGLAGMALSADAYHVQYFPVDRTINAARAGRFHGLLTEINFCSSDDSETDSQILEALTAAGEPYIYNELLDRGRGKGLIPLRQARPIEELPDCDSLTTTVHATGDVYACCELDISTDAMKRTPVFLGSIRSGAGPDHDNRERLVTSFYNPESTIYFRNMVKSHPMFAGLAKERFYNICDFCMRALGDSERVAALSDVLAGESRPRDGEASD